MEWIPPYNYRLKVNFDRASFGNIGLAGYGCVLRDSLGQTLWIKGGPIGVKNAIYAELTGLLEEGLRLLKDKGLRGCIMEGES